MSEPTIINLDALRGTFPSQAISAMIEQGRIIAESRDMTKQVQPSSLDFTLSSEAYRVPGSILPHRRETVRDLARAYARQSIDLSSPQLLERNKVYLVRIEERFDLPMDVAAYTNNKSSTGRIDVATRSLCDHNPRYDKIPCGYQGEVWLEVVPKSFDVVAFAGLSLNQAIFYRDRKILSTGELEVMSRDTHLLYDRRGRPLHFAVHKAISMPERNTTGSANVRTLPDAAGRPLDMSLLVYRDGKPVDTGEALVEDGLLMTLDLDQDVVGYVARRTYDPVDMSKVGSHRAEEFFEAVPRPRSDLLWLERGRFYILSTYEFIRVPPDYAVEMLPYDTSAGEFRAHYAGFFDPGFGYGLQGEEKGTPAVLEVRAYDDDLIVRHKQPICRMAYETLAERPSRLYHASIGSTYASQRGPRLSKYFA